MCLHSGVRLYAFQFLTLVRFCYPEFHYWKERLPRLVLPLTWFVAGVLTIAGSLEMAEEWFTVNGVHLDVNNQIQNMRSFWQYVYWTVITVSTVGYGDILALTQPGRVVVVMTVFLAIVWFISYSQMLVKELHELVSWELS